MPLSNFPSDRQMIDSTHFPLTDDDSECLYSRYFYKLFRMNHSINKQKTHRNSYTVVSNSNTKVTHEVGPFSYCFWSDKKFFNSFFFEQIQNNNKMKTKNLELIYLKEKRKIINENYTKNKHQRQKGNFTYYIISIKERNFVRFLLHFFSFPLIWSAIWKA